MPDGPADLLPPPTAPADAAAPMSSAPPAPPATTEPAPARLTWRDSWQVPTLLIAAALLVTGVVQVLSLPREHDFAGALDQVEGILAAGRIEEARTILFERIAPRLKDAADPERARFDALAADWIAAARTGPGFAAIENDRQIVERYQRAEEGGHRFSREQQLRWATALVQLGRTDEALARIEMITEERHEEDGLRARVRRMVMEKAWSEAVRSERPDWEVTLLAMGTYRADPLMPTGDEAWAAARQAEARLRLERYREAADRLLLDLRRLEAAPANGRPAAGSDAFAELAGLLGRAYAALGEPELARDSLERAVALSTDKSLVRGEAIVMLGQLGLERGEIDEAEQCFEHVLADYEGTSIHAAALFGRAEAAAVRGDHVASREDFRALCGLLTSGGAGSVRSVEVVGSLLDRHDTLLVAGELGDALEYARLAADAQPGLMVRPEVLLRLATTSRTLADRMLRGPDGRDQETMTRASRLLKSSGDWFLSHSGHPDAARESAEGWADSLWLAADSYERAGWTEDAIIAFRQFIEARPPADLRRAEAIFRVASILHAEGDLAEAAAQYARTIEEFPGSPVAARATVPLARCLEATGRRLDAIARLMDVVDGATGLKPDAPEYRTALLELGRLTVAAGELARAAVLLEEALKRYPDDPRSPEIRFELGECRRGLAREATRRLADGALAPSQRAAIDAQRNRDLETAQADFELVISMLERRPPEELDPLERDALRLSHLYRADCLFDLGRYRESIDLYEIAERRYSEHAISMVALVQIVNAWHALDETDRAATAERRAEIRLAQLPDSAFLTGESILSRDAWERWLRHRPPGPRLAGAGAARTAGTAGHAGEEQE